MKTKQGFDPRMTRQQRIEAICRAFPVDAEAIRAQAEFYPTKMPVIETDYGDLLDISKPTSGMVKALPDYAAFARAPKRVIWE